MLDWLFVSKVAIFMLVTLDAIWDWIIFHTPDWIGLRKFKSRMINLKTLFKIAYITLITINLR